MSTTNFLGYTDDAVMRSDAQCTVVIYNNDDLVQKYYPFAKENKRVMQGQYNVMWLANRMLSRIVNNPKRPLNVPWTQIVVFENTNNHPQPIITQMKNPKTGENGN